MHKDDRIDVDGHEYEVVQEFPVLHSGWDGDATGWVIRDGEALKLVLSTHGENYFADLEELDRLAGNYRKALAASEAAAALVSGALHSGPGSLEETQLGGRSFLVRCESGVLFHLSGGFTDLKSIYSQCASNGVIFLSPATEEALVAFDLPREDNPERSDAVLCEVVPTTGFKWSDPRPRFNLVDWTDDFESLPLSEDAKGRLPVMVQGGAPKDVLSHVYEVLKPSCGSTIAIFPWAY